MVGTVYHIFNTVTGKAYVGQTWRSVAKRWWEHQTASHCVALFGSIRKYGPGAFVCTPLTACLTQDEMDTAERYFVGHFGTRAPDGYNLREGGGAHGRHSPETREKMRRSSHGISPEMRVKLNASLKGVKRSVEGRKNISVSHRKWTWEEWQRAMKLLESFSEREVARRTGMSRWAVHEAALQARS